MYDVIIIGAGASGTMCAIKASSRGKKVLLLDNMATPAKKLMVTGNGKCNLTNLHTDSSKYNVNIDKYLNRFNVNNTIKFFNELGLVTHSDDEGRVYPFSNSARSVIDVITAKLKENKVEFLGERKVIKVTPKTNGYAVMTENEEFLTKSVVYACGGLSSTGLFKAGEMYPSLCALKTSENTKKLSGLRLSDVVVTATCGRKTMSDRGEVLFKDGGLSGIVVFNLSSLFARSKKYNGTISIDLMPDYTLAEVEKMVKSRTKSFKQNLFVGWLSDEIAKFVMVKSKVTKLDEVGCKQLAKTIKNLSFNICGFYDNPQVLSGGVELSKLDDNLQLKDQKGVYVIGEQCDVDGECGGYNLQWAWTSGWIVGSEV